MPSTLRRALLIALACLPLFSMAVRAAPLQPFEIETKGGVRHFDVEVMRTEAELQRGLMFRRELEPDHGMVFLFDGSRPILMWMKNTFLPLDMIFFREGRVVSIVQNTEPFSERLITSGENASEVIEVNAGTAARLGIAVGDRLLTPVAR